MHKLVLCLGALALTAGCGGSAVEIKTARDAVYNVDRAQVWAAAEAALKKRYPRINILERNEQRLLTNWIFVEHDVESQDAPLGMPGTNLRNALFMRVTIAVSEAAPYRVGIDVQAAQYRPNLTSLIPFPHGAADEPHWVEGRRDRLYTTIYENLQTAQTASR